MDRILLAELYAREFYIAEIDCYEQDESRDPSSNSRRHQLRCYGSALAKSEDIDIFFFWHAISFRSQYQNPFHYELEMDDAGIITADINRTLMLNDKTELDQVDANLLLIRFIHERIDWKPSVLCGLPRSKLTLIKNK